MKENDAIIDPTGTYRYCLSRQVTELGFAANVLWVMVNPSTADATENDHTIRKCLGFSERWGAGQLRVVNLFAFRSTDITRLREPGIDIVGPENDRHIADNARWADIVICAWGSKNKIPKTARHRPRTVFEILRTNKRESVRICCLGKTKDGDPLHPLMTPYGVELKEFRYA